MTQLLVELEDTQSSKVIRKPSVMDKHPIENKHLVAPRSSG